MVDLLEGEIPPGGAPPGGAPPGGGRAGVLWEVDLREEGPPDDLQGGVGNFLGMEIGGSPSCNNHVVVATLMAEVAP